MTDIRTDEEKSGIWLEVSEVRYDTLGKPAKCAVQLKADKAHPKPAWWPVEDKAAGKDAHETYKAILQEMDKKRTVLAQLSPSDDGKSLLCRYLRFQSAELSNR